MASNVLQTLIMLERGEIPLFYMDRMVAWNIRGANLPSKQSKIKHFIQKYYCGLVGLLETKVKIHNMGNLYLKVFNQWCFTSNSAHHPSGRIVVAWHPSSLTLGLGGILYSTVNSLCGSPK